MSSCTIKDIKKEIKFDFKNIFKKIGILDNISITDNKIIINISGDTLFKNSEIAKKTVDYYVSKFIEKYDNLNLVYVYYDNDKIELNLNLNNINLQHIYFMKNKNINEALTNNENIFANYY